MPIVVTADPKDSTGDVIKQFKKMTAQADVVEIARERRYFQKPAKVRADKKIGKKRLQKRLRKLKRMKNIPPAVIVRMTESIQA